MRVFIGGGQDYYGTTKDRDKQVVTFTSQKLYELHPDIEIVTGGTAGIPHDFLTHWKGDNKLCVVSEEYLETYNKTSLPGTKVIIAGKSQEARRIAITKLEGIVCALFVQGGKYSTHEMFLFGKIPIVSFWGSGGAAGGEQPYEGWTYPKPEGLHPLIYDTDPNTDPKLIADAIVHAISRIITPCSCVTCEDSLLCPLSPQILCEIIDDIIRENKEHFKNNEKLLLKDMNEDFSDHPKWKEYCLYKTRRPNHIITELILVKDFETLWESKHANVNIYVKDYLLRGGWFVEIPFSNSK